MSKYQVVMNLWPKQTDILFETDDLNEAIQRAKKFNDKDVEIWTDVTEDSYEVVDY